MVIGQAFSAAYKQFLRSSGISDQQLEQAEYTHILNAQSVPKLEVESLGDRNKIKKVKIHIHLQNSPAIGPILVRISDKSVYTSFIPFSKQQKCCV